MPDASKAQVLWGVKRRVGDLATAEALLGGSVDRLTRRWKPLSGLGDDQSVGDGVIAFGVMDEAVPAAVVARCLAFAGTTGVVHAPKAQGKTTLCAAAACAVARGRPFAGAPTMQGKVLVVYGDDPRSWRMRASEYDGGDNLLAVPAAKAVGKLPELLSKYEPVWVILDNLRTWARAAGAKSVDDSGDASGIIDPICEAVRDAGYPVALTILHNQGRSKMYDGNSGRMRNSTVFEDAVDWIVSCTFDGVQTTTVTHGEKTRHGIPTENLPVTIGPNGETSTTGPSEGAGGGGGGHLEPGAPDVHPELQRDADAIHAYIMRSGPASIRAARSAVKLQGRQFYRFQRALDHLVMNGRIRRLDGARNTVVLTAESASSGSASRIRGVEPRNRSTGSSGSANGTGGGTTAEPVPGTGSALKGNHSPEPVPGTGSRNRSGGTGHGRRHGVQCRPVVRSSVAGFVPRLPPVSVREGDRSGVSEEKRRLSRGGCRATTGRLREGAKSYARGNMAGNGTEDHHRGVVRGLARRRAAADAARARPAAATAWSTPSSLG